MDEFNVSTRFAPNAGTVPVGKNTLLVILYPYFWNFVNIFFRN